jgi:hypothetical protein
MTYMLVQQLLLGVVVMVSRNDADPAQIDLTNPGSPVCRSGARLA